MNKNSILRSILLIFIYVSYLSSCATVKNDLITSNKPINGLRHFVLVNEIKEKGDIFFWMVSVLDSEINFKTTYEELINSGKWYKGWINLPKIQSITEEYVYYKSSSKLNGIDEIYIKEDSPFNIS